MSNLKLEQESLIVLKLRMMVTGFVAGIFLYVTSYISAFFNFLNHSLSSMIFEWFPSGYVFNNWTKEGITIVIVCLVSIAITYGYYFLFKKIYNIWFGIAFGTALWFIFYVWLLDGELDLNALITSLCILILYGVFISSTIGYDFMDVEFD